jgi:hypothetical protein
MTSRWLPGDELRRHVNGQGWIEKVVFVDWSDGDSVLIRFPGGQTKVVPVRDVCKPTPKFHAWMAAYEVADEAQRVLDEQAAAAGMYRGDPRNTELPVWQHFRDSWQEADRLGREYWLTQPR